MKLSARVYKYRVKNNLTQEEFGKKIGLTRWNVSKLENETYKPNKRILMKMRMLEKGE